MRGNTAKEIAISLMAFLSDHEKAIKAPEQVRVGEAATCLPLTGEGIPFIAFSKLPTNRKCERVLGVKR